MPSQDSRLAFRSLAVIMHITVTSAVVVREGIVAAAVAVLLLVNTNRFKLFSMSFSHQLGSRVTYFPLATANACSYVILFSEIPAKRNHAEERISFKLSQLY